MAPRLGRLLRAPDPPAPAPLAQRLARAGRMIDLGWTVAVLWAVLRLAGGLWLTRGGVPGEALWLLDPALIVLLAWGLYRRASAAAVLLLFYVVVELYFAYHRAGAPAGVGAGMLLELSFLTGLRGTLLYRAALREAAAETMPGRTGG